MKILQILQIWTIKSGLYIQRQKKLLRVKSKKFPWFT